VGDPEIVAEKILRVNESLGSISRLTFQMSVAALPHAKLMCAIELLGTRVAPRAKWRSGWQDYRFFLPKALHARLRKLTLRMAQYDRAS